MKFYSLVIIFFCFPLVMLAGIWQDALPISADASPFPIFQMRTTSAYVAKQQAAYGKQYSINSNVSNSLPLNVNTTLNGGRAIAANAAMAKPVYSSVLKSAISQGVMKAPPTFDDGYGRSLDEWADGAVVYTIDGIKYYDYGKLLELYNQYCKDNGHAPADMGWEELLAWLRSNTQDKIKNHRLPLPDAIGALLVLAVIYAALKKV